LSLAQTCGDWQHDAYQHPLPDLRGDPMFTDVLQKGPANASRRLVITSGTHGVEGFCGSALQSQFIKDNHVLPEDFAVILIHAINPFGFSHLRRVTEDNVDLNRNFVDFHAELPANTAYQELDSLLNPAELPPGALDQIMVKLLEIQASMDFLSFLKAVSGGQYQFPRGMQFGGVKETWSRTTVESIWTRYLAGAETVVQIDIHTGLGPKSIGTLMMSANDDEPRHALVQDWFGAMLITPRPTSAEDTILAGYLNAGMEEALPQTTVIPITLEYGTVPPDVVLRTMIEENWLTQHGDLDSPLGQEIKNRLLRAFYPDCEDWRLAIMQRGKEVFSQALNGLDTIAPGKRTAP
jgi:hypothetical protein